MSLIGMIPKRSIFITICVALLALSPIVTGCISAAQAGVTPPMWRRYVNVRFSYTACYPAALLVPQGEAPNSDGQKFVGTKGAKLLVYGAFNLDRLNIKAWMAKVRNRLVAHGATITYQRLGFVSFVLSGIEGNTIIYDKRLLDGPVFKTFLLSYRISQRATFDPLIARMASCFSNMHR